MGISSSGATVGGPTSNMSSQSSAGPASGKYGGFGNKDMEQMGYNNPAYGGSSSGYDPYVNKASSTTTASQSTSKKEDTHKQEKPKKKKKKADSSDEDSSDSSKSDSSSEEEKSDDDKKKKKKGQGLGAPK
jgi:hypothetical protein